jgi:hypothetical protein
LKNEKFPQGMNCSDFSMAAGLKFPPLAEKQEKLLLRFGTQCRFSQLPDRRDLPCEAEIPRKIRHGLPSPAAVLLIA